MLDAVALTAIRTRYRFVACSLLALSTRHARVALAACDALHAFVEGKTRKCAANRGALSGLESLLGDFRYRNIVLQSSPSVAPAGTPAGFAFTRWEGSTGMKVSDFGRYALKLYTAVAMLAACGAGVSPPVSPAAKTSPR
jgi:hypothetical protein